MHALVTEVSFVVPTMVLLSGHAVSVIA